MEKTSTLIYDGGLYRFGEFEETLTDAGGFILRREDSVVSTIAVISVPDIDLELIRKKANEIGGTLKEASLAGSEIAVIAPSPSGKHLPHPTCDIAEYLRRSGAQTILISLARGAGQEPLLDSKERCLINECDLAVFVLGDSAYCLRYRKTTLFKGVQIPIIVAGGPHLRKLPSTQAYIGGFGRRSGRVKASRDIQLLTKLVAIVDDCLSRRRDEIYPNLPELSMPALKEAIEDQVPEIKSALSPSPVTIRLDGLRIKLPFDKYHVTISQIVFDNRRLEEFTTITKSVLGDHVIITLRPGSIL